MLQHIKRFVAIGLALLCLPMAPSAQAKTVADWLSGFETGEAWFGEDFAYDITDEAACWELLMRPIVILDAEQREKIYLRQTPDGKKVNTDKLGGYLNGASAAVHVLGEDEGGWTLVEGLDDYNRLLRGYVRTRLIKTVTPNDDFGIIIDKLTQRLYVFKDGKLWDSCLVSTGLATGEQPYNETAAGEYLICSWVGDFDSEGMVCATALRFNGGDLIHEVPHNINYDGTKNYSRWEALLGQKASHGCVRTQRMPTEKGLCAKWLWDNMKKNTKVVIWDDMGRKMPYPEDDRELYYNPEGGSYYHADPRCQSVKSKYLPLTPFAYADLDSGVYLSLEACTVCQPPKRKSLIARENLERGAITQAEYLQALTPIPYPARDSLVYHNPDGGKYYHSTARCASVKERFLPLSDLPYHELEGRYAKLSPCPYCAPPLKPDDVDEANLKQGFAKEQVKALRAAYDAGEDGAVPFADADAAGEATGAEVDVSITIR